MQSPSIKVQIAFMIVFLALALTVAAIPARFFDWLGRGRALPSAKSVVVLRAIAVVCAIGSVYRIAQLFGV